MFLFDQIFVNYPIVYLKKICLSMDGMIITLNAQRKKITIRLGFREIF